MNVRTLLASVALCFAAASPAVAQVANISTTAGSSFVGLNLTTSMTSAISNTYFPNDGDTMLNVRTTGSPTTVTLVTQAQSIDKQGYGSVGLSNQVVAVPANTYMLLGPFPQGRWNTMYGTVAVSFSTVIGVSVTAVSQSQ